MTQVAEQVLMRPDASSLSSPEAPPAAHPLSILHISARDNYGGSARGAYRVHQDLRMAGWRSHMLVAKAGTDDPDVAPIWGTLPWRIADRLLDAMTERLSLQYAFIPSSYRLPSHPWFREADIVQLYNLHGGYFSFPLLRHLARVKPLVWRLDDMWPLTGHCSYAYECTRWRDGCGACPHLSEFPALRHDTTRLLWRLKRWAYGGVPLTLVVPSQWMAERVRESPLLQHCPVHVIPFAVDTDRFRPMPKVEARQWLGLPLEGRIVLFCAQSVTERRKGGELLQQALRCLAREGAAGDLTLAVAGHGAATWRTFDACRVAPLGFLPDDRLLAAAYAAADVFVLPTQADGLGLVLLEALACGTPAVTFDIGGCREVVRHGQTGYLARAGSPDDLARGLAQLLAHEDLRQWMAQQCRDVAEREYAARVQLGRYTALYHSVLEVWNAHRERRGGP